MVAQSTARPPFTEEQVNRIFRALADATRRDIVRRTLARPANVSSLAADYEMSFAAVQKHVGVLEGAGLVRKQQRGRQRMVHGDPSTLRHVQQLLDDYTQIWRGRITRLDALLEDEQAAEESARSTPTRKA